MYIMFVEGSTVQVKFNQFKIIYCTGNDVQRIISCKRMFER